MQNGFEPPAQDGVRAQYPLMSKKAVRKLRQAEDERRANEEKARRLAEEEENRLKKNKLGERRQKRRKRRGKPCGRLRRKSV